MNSDVEKLVFKRIDALKNYCEENKHWVKAYYMPKNEEEKLANSLERFLVNAGYYGNFKYSSLKYKGVYLKLVLDSLFLNYGNRHKYYDEFLKKKVLEIVEFGNKNKCFPKHIDNPKNDIEIVSNYYDEFLNKLGYKVDNKFLEYIRVDDKPLYLLLDDLYYKYVISKERKMEVLNYFNRVRNYCLKKREWPINQDEEALALSYWLEESGYYEDFKYDFIEENGMSIKRILDNYYHIYGKNYDVYDLDIWKIKDSKDRVMALAGYMAILAKAIYSDMDMFQYVVSMIKKEIKELNLDLDINIIIGEASLACNDQVKLYYKKYLDNIDDSVLSKLYFNLFNINKGINERINEERRRK